MSLNNANDIVNSVKFDEKFSTVDTIANLVGNKRFLKGYVDMLNGQDTALAYIWTALSAVANDIGNTIYTNILNYVDLVSDVDTCKVVALRSMLNMEGIDLTLFKNFSLIPVDLLQLIDVLSIDRKILARFPYLNEAFRSDMLAASLATSDKDDFDELTELSGDVALSVDLQYFSDNQYKDYITRLYKTVITDFLKLEYNITKSSSSEHFYIYPTILSSQSFDTYVIDNVRQYKLRNGIPVEFNEQTIVTNIENHTDSIDNYSGVEYQLLMYEFKRRSDKLLASDLAENMTVGFDSTGSSLENKTRYSFYRKQKVKQYVDFVNLKYFFDTNLTYSGKTYSTDPNYIEVDLTNSRKSVIKANPIGNPKLDFDESMIAEVAESLMKMTLQICSLRQKIKKQVRKNYMKGTNNLFLYIVNLYLLEYGTNSVLTTQELSTVYENLANSDASKLNVVEYYDKTDYYNLTTDQSVNAERNDTSDRFWNTTKKYNSFARNGLAFELLQIEKFYLSSMMLKSGIGDDLSGFLDAIYDTGAVKSHYDSETGIFNTKLENGKYALENYSELTSLSSNFDVVTTSLNVKDGILSDALTASLDEYYQELSTTYLSGISDVDDEYRNKLYTIQQGINALAATFKTTLTSDGQYSQYDVVADSLAKVELLYIYQKLTDLNNSAIVSLTALHNSKLTDSVKTLLTDLTATTGLSVQLVNDIITKISNNPASSTAFTDPCHSDLDSELNSVITYLVAYNQTSNSPEYQGYLQTAYNIRRTYTNHVDDFNAICNLESLTMAVLALPSLVTITASSLTDYLSKISSADSANYQSLKSFIDTCFDTYATLSLEYISYAQKLKSLIGFDYSSQYLEEQISEALAYLTVDKTRKYRSGMRRLLANFGIVDNAVKVLSTSISTDLSTDIAFSVAIQNKIDSLNFFDDEFYNFNKDIMLTYGGLTFAYYPYANYKNTTHPSYLIHPYLWNFIELDSVVKSSIAKLFLSVSLNMLEDSAILTIADEYFGKFGQTINIWKHFGVLDYSGYITDYEYSKHMSNRSALTSEVVDYDGPFYPPAVDMLVADYDSCISSLSARTGEFYERFYRHLAFSESELSAEIGRYDEYWKNSTLSKYITTVSSIVADRPLSTIYDIYKYGKDKYDNHYTLYKQYFTEHPSYKHKKNTLGELWIRAKDHPVSFPAFTGKSPMFDMSTEGSVAEGIRKVAKIALIGITSPDIHDRMRYFFDFELSKNRKNLALVMHNRDTDCLIYETPSLGETALTCYNLPLIYGYENSWIMSAPILKTTVENRPVFLLVNISTANSQNVLRSSFIRSGEYNLTNRSTTPLKRPVEEYSSVYAYAFLGMYEADSTSFNLVYVKKCYMHDMTCIASTADSNFKIIKLLPSGPNFDYANTTGDADVSFPGDLVSDEICFTYDEQSSILVLAVLTKIVDYTLQSTLTSSCVDLSTNTEGVVFDDPRRDLEMTSHDILDSNVTLIKVNVAGGLSIVCQNEHNTYNLNADMAFRPAYPGLSGEFHHRDSISSDATTSIQLLGKSKSLDAQIELIDPTADPYFDVEKIYNEYRFGRVYEDYIDEDNSIKIIETPLVTNIVRDPAITKSRDEYIINIDFSLLGFTDHNFETSKILIFNSKTSGKNPYYISDFKRTFVLAPTSEIWHPTMYNEPLSGLGISETTISGDSHDIRLAGTYTGTKRNAYDSNYIFNISDMNIRFVKSTKTMQLKFIIDNPSLLDFTHLEKGEIKIVLFNICDLRMFKYYHFLDAYGAVNARSAKYDINMTESIPLEPWRVVYNNEDVGSRDLTTIIGDISSYYTYHNSEHMLANIDLSQYDYLKDVYILLGRGKLQFKIDEDDFWPLSSKSYYYPVLNLKYPKVLADYVNDFNPYKAISDGQSSYTRVLGDTNTFILDLIDPAEVAPMLTDLNIPVYRTTEEALLVYEDFTDYDTDAGMYHYLKFAAEDVRNLPFYQFTEISDVNTSNSLLSGQLSSLSSRFDTIDGFLGEFQKSCKDIAVLKGDSDVKSTIVNYVNVKSELSDINIDEFVKLYVNYSRTSNGIVLYFNYYNYIDSPYVRMDGNKTYSAILPTTYLSVLPNESGFIDMIVQARYYSADQLYGYKNINLMTYLIFNVSDDKPKFTIRRVNAILPEQYVNKDNAEIAVTLDNVYVDASLLNSYSQNYTGILSTEVNIHIRPNMDIAGRYEFDLVYPTDILKFTSSPSTYRYTTNILPNIDDLEYMHISVVDNSLRDIHLTCETTKTFNELRELANQKYLIYLDELTCITDSGSSVKTTTNDAYVMFDTDSLTLLKLSSDDDVDLVLGNRQHNVITI